MPDTPNPVPDADGSAGEPTTAPVPPLVPQTVPTMAVISTAQNGVCVNALRAAREAGFPTGGYMTRSYGTMGGPRPEYRGQFGVIALQTRCADDRLKACVIASDATLLFVSNENSQGAQKVLAMLREAGKPYRVVPCRQVNMNAFQTDPELLAQLPLTIDWLMHQSPRILHVWGPTTHRVAQTANVWIAGLLSAYRTITSAGYSPQNSPFTSVEPPDEGDDEEHDDEDAPVARVTSAPAQLPAGDGIGPPLLADNQRWRGAYVENTRYLPGDVTYLEETAYARNERTQGNNTATPDPRSDAGGRLWQPIAELDEEGQWRMLR